MLILLRVNGLDDEIEVKILGVRKTKERMKEQGIGEEETDEDDEDDEDKKGRV